jgi:hypothetical protein
VVGSVALRKTCLHGRASCRLGVFGLRGRGSEHAGHRGGCLELQRVGHCARCVAFGVGVLRGVRKPGVHRRWRGISRQRAQQCSKAIAAGDKTIEGRAHGAASRLMRNFAKA